MNSNLIDFCKFASHNKVNVDKNAAKIFFINEVLPHVGITSLQRLIIANSSDNPELVRLEMMRMFVESELMKSSSTDGKGLNLFFSES